MSYRIDLHTHSYGSPDGGLLLKDYRYFLQHDLLDYFAVTDHNRIDTALHIREALAEYGNRVIIGEEIMTQQGEIIGLYLTEAIEPGLSLADAIASIRNQGGLVYVPHPFETIRSGVKQADLEQVAAQVDIIEIYNGRAIFQNRSALSKTWAKHHGTSGAASSDTHGRIGWGQTYSVIDQAPTRQNMVAQLHQATYTTRSVGVGALYPKLNRLKARVVRTKVPRGTV
jgi:predicted metal-dependent phosphoesterase TrpH